MSDNLIHAAFYSAWDTLHQLVRSFSFAPDDIVSPLTNVAPLTLKVFRISSSHSYPHKSTQIR